MGWGYYLEARKDHGTDHEQRRELIYWHKFDDLYHEIRNEIRYEPPDFFKAEEEDNGTGEVVLNKEQLKYILRVLCMMPDYWADYSGEHIVPDVQCTNGFGTVVKMCEIVEQYDLITSKGWEIVFFYG